MSDTSQPDEVVEYKVDEHVYTYDPESARDDAPHPYPTLSLADGPCQCESSPELGFIVKAPLSEGPAPVQGVVECCPQCDRAWLRTSSDGGRDDAPNR